MLESIGALELTSVGLGFVAQDAMLKAGDVRLVLGLPVHDPTGNRRQPYAQPTGHA